MSETNPQVALQRIYLKDLSFESPSPLKFFRELKQPKVNLDLSTKVEAIEGDFYEVSLELTVKTELENGETVFIVEVEQAGIFSVSGFGEEDKQRILRTFCPNTLFPYARESIDNLCMKGSFPPLHLSPINFEALYAQSKAH